MASFMQTLAVISVAVIAKGTEAMLCSVGQEPDPRSNGAYRWVIPVADPCRCTRVRLRGINPRPARRAFNVTYHDSVQLSDNLAEIRGWLNCTAAACSPLQAPLNGLVSSCADRSGNPSSPPHHFGSVCEVTCNQGYRLEGQVSRSCSKNGTWNGGAATCKEITCSVSDLPRPVGGQWNGCDGDHVQLGANCSLSCDTGFYPITGEQIKCLSDDGLRGAWSSDSFVCTDVKCGTTELSLPAHTTVNGPLGDQAFLLCDANFRPAADGLAACEPATDDNRLVGQRAGIVLCSEAEEWLVYKHLGLEYRSIVPDSRFQASGELFWKASGILYYAGSARLDSRNSWCSSERAPSWIDVDLGEATQVSGVLTQGNSYSPIDESWRVTKYKVLYQPQTAGLGYQYVRAVDEPQEFTGNVLEGETPAVQLFAEAITATRVKIEVTEWYRQTAVWPCLRLELLGARLN